MYNAFADAAVRRMTLFLPLLLAAAGTAAQPEQAEQVSSDELKAFAVVYVEVRVLQTELDERIDEVLESSDLTRSRFYEVNRAAQDSQVPDEASGVSEEEFDEYRDALEELLAVQNELQQRMTAAVREEDLSVERFNEIIDAVQNDPHLQTRAEATMERLIETREPQAGTGSDSEAESGRSD